MKYIKSAAKILDRDYVNRRGLYFSKEVVWVSVGQRAAELPAVKIGGQKNSAVQPNSNTIHPCQAEWQIFFKTPNLSDCSSAAF